MSFCGAPDVCKVVCTTKQSGKKCLDLLTLIEFLEYFIHSFRKSLDSSQPNLHSEISSIKEIYKILLEGRFFFSTKTIKFKSFA